MKDYKPILEKIANLKALYAQQVRNMDDIEQAICMQALWGDELKGPVSCGIQWGSPRHTAGDTYLEIRHNGEKREFKLEDVPAPLRTKKLQEFLDRERNLGECISVIFMKKRCQQKGWLPNGKDQN